MKKGIFCFMGILFVATGFSQNVSYIKQVGSLNEVFFERQESGKDIDLGTNYFNDSSIDQIGDGNFTNFIIQIGQNTSVITQDGDDNDVDIIQDGGDNRIGYGSALNQDSNINQVGNENYALVGQWGEGQVSDLDQIGNGNYADIELEGRKNTTQVSQEGDGNSSRVWQGLPGVAGNFNWAKTVQVSAGLVPSINPYTNISEIDQIGDLNWAEVTQDGDNNESYITQTTTVIGMMGDPYANEATVMQGGNLNLSTITQGDAIGVSADNEATVIQGNVNPNSAGNVSTIIQEGANTVYVFQLDF